MKNVQQPAQPQTQQTRRDAYQPPHVQTLGRWQAVTLIQSVPINPGSVNGFFGNPFGGQNGQ